MLTERITTLRHADLSFDVIDSGPLDGEPVVLLHGFPTDSTCWSQVSARLHDAGLRTFALDQRGYSPDARPDDKDAYRSEHLVADVLALVNAIGAEKVHLVGHDWGGGIAWLTAGNHPDRVASVTVLSTPHPAAMARALRSPDQLRRSWYMGAFQLPALPERVFAAWFRSLMVASGMPSEDIEHHASRFARPDALRGPINWYRGIRSSSLRTHRVRVPATLVWGSRDPALGRRAAELTREHVFGPYEFVELDAGHWLPETRADESAAAIIRRVRSIE